MGEGFGYRDNGGWSGGHGLYDVGDSSAVGSGLIMLLCKEAGRPWLARLGGMRLSDVNMSRIFALS